jgi:dTDP-4-amino-4,6-dideoxygalactose transaminase
VQNNRLQVIPEVHVAGDPAAHGIRVPFVRPALPPVEAVRPALEEILHTGRLTKGPFVERFEAAIAARLGVRHAVAVSSCTVGLMLVYRGLDLASGGCRSRNGIARGCTVGTMESVSRFGIARSTSRLEPLGEVIIPSFTFLAAPAAIVWNNLRPVFVDVDPRTTNVVPQAVKAAITPRTVAIAACHNFGNPCDVPVLGTIAAEHGLPLIIDAAHGFGSSVFGRPVGAGATAQVFSLSPTKLLVAGEGGIVVTDCDCLAHFIRLGREYGNDGDYSCSLAGLNGRLPELSAALGHASLERLPEVVARRRAAAQAYLDVLRETPGLGFQAIAPHAASSWKDFSITIDPDAFGAGRDAVRAHLAAQGIDARAYYSPPCHRMPAFARYHEPTRRLAATDSLAACSLSLPMGAHVTPPVARAVAACVLDARS